eukprot:CAMPEP_0175862760 /NCGR_PEP_ID=MMETSP0107_2-20121207/32123_1 /TAXON_ID=195067 ORGANISM="Goniomonas pacifica, Strain CCMP1869" /NCGR_SAMPLE_ID=MMETSP0107_2 /ASSEMBLY_ACC=CAM_ASM_000203 /LENGTH=178 /DNA_ID=CAMNT_0017179793 /DNA_START=25 /DNA_END=561 /DNA_ORIENTATION=+
MYCLASLGGTGGASGDVVLGVEHVVLGGLARAGPAVPGASRVEAVENVLLLGTAGPAGEVASGVKGGEDVVLGLVGAPASPGADSVERVENVALLLTASPAGEVASGVKGIENVVLGLGAGAGPAVPLASTKLGRTDGNLGDDGHSKDGSASKDGESDKVLARVGGAAEKRGSFDGHV